MKRLILAMLLIAPSAAAIAAPKLDQPYILYLEHPSKSDYKACHDDLNCMDVMAIKDHQSRILYKFLEANKQKVEAITDHIKQVCTVEEVETGCATDACCEAIFGMNP